MRSVLKLSQIVGFASEPDIAERLHRLDHEGKVERIHLNAQDMARHRLRVQTDRGQECAIALPRSVGLRNGAVLLLEDERAVLVRMLEQQWLKLDPRDTAAAIELGYFAGNMHWRVSFDGPCLKVALDGPEQDYLERLRPFLSDGRVVRRTDG